MKHFFLILVISFVSASTIIDISDYDYPKPEETKDTLTIAILSTNDIHGTFYPTDVSATYPDGTVEEFQTGGLEYLGKYISIMREEWKEKFLYFDIGDEFQGGIESKLTDGEIMTDFFVKANCTCATIGNHEWDFGQEYLKKKVGNESLSYLVANLESDKFLLPKMKMLNVSGVKIGVIGVTTVLTPETTRGDLTGVSFLPYKDVIENAADELRSQGANAVVLISHAGLKCPLNPKDELLELKIRTKDTVQKPCNDFDEVPVYLKNLDKGKIDIIFAGHKHAVTHHWIEGIPVTSSDRNGAFAEIAYLSFDKNNNYKLKKDEIKLEGPLPVCSKVFEKTKRCDSSPKEPGAYGKLSQFSFHGQLIEKDKEIEKIGDKFKPEYEKKVKEVLTRAESDFYASKDEETALGNLYTDFIKRVTGAKMVVVNTGSLRTIWKAGTSISVASVYNMSPFENTIVTFEMTGSEIKRMMFQIQGGKYSFYQTSGLKQVVLKNEKGKKKLLTVKFWDGYKEETIDDTQTYLVASSDFCFPGEGQAGGDDFKEVSTWYTPRNFKTSVEIREAITDYLRTIDSLKESDYYDPQNPRLRIVEE